MSSKHHQRSLLALVLALFLSNCRSPGAGQAKEGEPPVGIAFEESEVVTDLTKRQTVLTGFLLGGPVSDLAVLSIDEKEEKVRLRIYAHGAGTWTLKQDVTLGPDVQFVDVAKIAGRDRLITYRDGRLNWFDPNSKMERSLVAVSSNFKPPRSNEIPHVDITRDVTGDQRDDLLVPDTDGFWVFGQMSDGTFAKPVKIGPPTDLSGILGADGYRYDPWSHSRIHEIDYNRDGHGDLAFWNSDHFEVHLQDKAGRFAPQAKTFPSAVPFDTDKIYALATGKLTGRALHSLADMNGDGIPDLVVHALEGKRASKKRSTYEVHFGAPSANGTTAFAPNIGTTFHTNKRVHLGMDRLDLDGDGKMDLMLTTIESRFLTGSPWKSLKGMMGDDIRLELEFYRMTRGTYPTKPNTTRRIGLDGAPSHREPGSVSLDIALRGATHLSRKTQKRWLRAFNPNLLIGDVTGDGRQELMIESTFRDLPVFPGVAGPGLFAQRSQAVRVMLPADNEYSWLVDLNKDGKQDIVMHHPFTLRDVHGGRKQPPGTEAHRVVLLMAK